MSGSNWQLRSQDPSKPRPPSARHGIEGILVTPCDPGALADGVRVLLDDPQRARTFAENGVVRSREYAWDAIIERLEEVYYEAVGASAGLNLLAEV